MMAFLLCVASVPFVLSALYLGLLAMVARETPPLPPSDAMTRFDVLVPAHDEAEGIATTIESLLEIEYPAARRRILVIADNCRDATAERARAAGALVLERFDDARRGKGHALAFGIEASLAHGWADAIVVVDADTTVSPTLLRAFDAVLAAGETVAQADYAVRNAADSWRTKLARIALALFHGVRSLARERLGLSCGLRGNGMCLHRDALRRVPPAAFSVTEDVEYGIQLGMAGVRVAYAPAARVWGDMPSTARASRTQRARWEGGRRQLARRYAWTLVRTGFANRDVMRLDLAADLLVAPLSQLAAGTVVGLCLALTLAPATSLAVVLWTIAAAALLAYVARGCVVSRLGARGAAALAWAPAYVAWKLALRATRSLTTGDEWIRTMRGTANRSGG
jgi:cellulose synthase/poly-beta-1,6-N-acetylglucosamine synthase-like glycosyltransferase